MTWTLFGTLALIAFIVELLLLVGVFVHITHLRSRKPPALSEGIGATRAILAKVRKREPMTLEEAQYARQVIADRRSLLAFCIPAAVFTLGCFYVLGSLEQLHGATPSERTFLGVIPMFSSLNITAQLLRIGKLKKRLPAGF